MDRRADSGLSPVRNVRRRADCVQFYPPKSVDNFISSYRWYFNVSAVYTLFYITVIHRRVPFCMLCCNWGIAVSLQNLPDSSPVRSIGIYQNLYSGIIILVKFPGYSHLKKFCLPKFLLHICDFGNFFLKKPVFLCGIYQKTLLVYLILVNAPTKSTEKSIFIPRMSLWYTSFGIFKFRPPAWLSAPTKKCFRGNDSAGGLPREDFRRRA